MGESRAYRLEPGEPLPGGIARIARGRIDHAVDELRGNTGSTPEQAVHEARKDMKKLRASRSSAWIAGVSETSPSTPAAAIGTRMLVMLAPDT